MKVGIAAHEDRIVNAHNLSHAVWADHVSVDDGTLGCEGNHRKVWRAISDIAQPDEWCVVLEDDAIPVPDFRRQAEAALAVAPATVVSFYLGRINPVHWQGFIEKAVSQADSVDACWITSDTTLHAVGIAIRTPKLVNAMLKRTSEYARPIDERITMWCRNFGHPTAYTHPSLVDHADGDPVIAQRRDGTVRTPGRVAWSYGPRRRWTTSSVPLLK